MTMPTKALAEVYRRAGLLVRRRCEAILGDRAEAEDIMHEVFIRLFRYGKFQTADAVPLAFLYRTAERCCFDRRDKRRREGPSERAEGLPVVAVEARQAKSGEAGAALRRLFALIPKRLHQLAVLHYLDGLPQERIAQQLDWSVRSVSRKVAKLETVVARAAKTEGLVMA